MGRFPSCICKDFDVNHHLDDTTPPSTPPGVVCQTPSALSELPSPSADSPVGRERSSHDLQLPIYSSVHDERCEGLSVPSASSEQPSLITRANTLKWHGYTEATLWKMHDQARLDIKANRLDPAECAMQIVVQGFRHIFGLNHDDTVMASFFLATVLQALGRTKEVEGILEEIALEVEWNPGSRRIFNMLRRNSSIWMSDIATIPSFFSNSA